MRPDAWSPAGVTRRLRAMSDRTDLTAARRLTGKVDMAPGAVTRRLRTQSMLRDACLAWGRRRRSGSEAGPPDCAGGVRAPQS